jgi:hypothetical protein
MIGLMAIINLPLEFVSQVTFVTRANNGFGGGQFPFDLRCHRRSGIAHTNCCCCHNAGETWLKETGWPGVRE